MEHSLNTKFISQNIYTSKHFYEKKTKQKTKLSLKNSKTKVIIQNKFDELKLFHSKN